MKKTSKDTLTTQQQRQIEALAALPDDDINTRDIPEIFDWSDAKRGIFYRPVKQQITLRIDADVIAWFKSKMSDKKGYQTTINHALREYVLQHASDKRE